MKTLKENILGQRSVFVTIATSEDKLRIKIFNIEKIQETENWRGLCIFVKKKKQIKEKNKIMFLISLIWIWDKNIEVFWVYNFWKRSFLKSHYDESVMDCFGFDRNRCGGGCSKWRSPAMRKDYSSCMSRIRIQHDIDAKPSWAQNADGSWTESEFSILSNLLLRVS